MQTLLTYGSFLFAALGLACAWLNGRAPTRPLAVRLQLVVCVLLVPYNVATGQYGFLAANVVLFVVYSRNLAHARRERALLVARR